MAKGKGPRQISSAAQVRVERAFAQQLGQTIIAYGRIESFLCTWFERITKMPGSMARRIFYSQNGTYATIQLFKSALGSVSLVPHIEPFLIGAVNKLQQYSETRNLMAHGDALFVRVDASKYNGQMIIMRGREPWGDDPPSDEILTIANLANAANNFGRLGFCLLVPLSWDGKDPEKSPDKYLRLVRLLPTLAHSTVLDPTIAKPFEIAEVELPHWR